MQLCSGIYGILNSTLLKIYWNGGNHNIIDVLKIRLSEQDTFGEWSVEKNIIDEVRMCNWRRPIQRWSDKVREDLTLLGTREREMFTLEMHGKTWVG